VGVDRADDPAGALGRADADGGHAGEVANGILHLNRTGCQWRAIPNDLPNWNTCRHYYDRFRRDGTWERVHDALRSRVRVAAGKQPTPSAAVISAICTVRCSCVRCLGCQSCPFNCGRGKGGRSG
jgi:transposase